MTDAKKFVTGFLVLAVLTSSIAIGVAGLLNSKNSTEVQNLNTQLENEQASALSKGSVFVETIPKVLPGPENTESSLPPVEDPTNLTEGLARKLTEEMGGLNPEEGGLISEKVNLVVQDIGASGEILNIEAINRELAEANQALEKESADFEVEKNYTPEDLTQYTNQINLITQENLGNSELTRILNQASITISPVELALDQTILRLKELKTPEPFYNFQKSFLKLVLYQKKVIEMAQDENDPLKSGLVFQLQEKDYSEAILNFQKELDNLKSLENISSLNNSGLIAKIFSDIFSIKKAHAFFVISFSPTEFGRTIWEWAQKVLTEKLKKKLVNMIVKQTINWIQGGGKPKFVQDFNGFLKEAADKTFGNEIYKHLPGLCSRIRPWVEIAFYQAPEQAVNLTDRTRCTVTEIVQNLEDFYHSFDSGGWKNYLTIIRPENNYFGSIIELHDLALNKSAQQASADKVKVGSNQGFLTTRVCKQKENLSVSETYGTQGPYTEEDARYVASQAGMDYIDGSFGGDSFEACPPNGWEETTPGKTIAETLDRAVGAHLDWIVNSNDLIALATAFIDSLINKMFQKGAEGLANVISSQPQQNNDYRQTCLIYRPGSPEYVDCVKDAQDINQINEQFVLSSSTLISTAQSYQDLFEIVARADNDYLTGLPSVVNTIQLIIQFCSDNTPPLAIPKAELSKQILELNTSIIMVQREIYEANANITWLADFIVRVRAATTNLELAELTQEIEGKFDATLVGQNTGTAQTRLQDLINLRNSVNRIWDSRHNDGSVFEMNFCHDHPIP